MQPICPSCDTVYDSHEAVAKHRINEHTDIRVTDDGEIMVDSQEQQEQLMDIIYEESASKHPDAWGVA